MKAVVDIMRDNEQEDNEQVNTAELLEFRTVLAKCFGENEIDITCDLVKQLKDGNSYPLHQITTKGKALMLVKGDYLYISINMTDEAAAKFIKSFRSSLQDDVASVFSIIKQEEIAGMVYHIMIIQPIVVYKDGSGIEIISELDKLLYDAAEVDYERLDREVESEINYQLEMEDEEEDIQERLKEKDDSWLEELKRLR